MKHETNIIIWILNLSDYKDQDDGSLSSDLSPIIFILAGRCGLAVALETVIEGSIPGHSEVYFSGLFLVRW